MELAVQLWKEVRSFIHDSHDKKDAAEGVVAVLMENFDAEEILEAFKFDKNIVNCVIEYAGEDAVDTDIDDLEFDDY